jgi:two-component system NtrC family sensor kinase
MTAAEEIPAGAPAAGAALHRRTLTALRMLAVASVALPILMLCVGGGIAWQQTRQEASAETIRIVDLVYESTAKLFGAQLLALEQTRLMIEGMDDAAIEAQQRELHDRLAAMLRYLPHLRDIYVVSRQGLTLVDGTWFPMPSVNDVSERDYFAFFRNGGSGRFIGQPGKRLMDDQSFVPLAVARAGADGTFNGVISSSINPDYFAMFFRQVLSAYPDFDGRTITLRRGDGRLLVRTQGLSPPIAAASETLAADILKPAQDSGYFVSDRTGETRIMAWRRLPDVDMVIFTSVSLAGVLGGWIDTMIPYGVIGLGSALALFCITMVALRRTYAAASAEQQAAAERLRREQAEDTVRHIQKMEALGELTGGVAHDFNNLLAVIQGSAELAKTRPPERIGRLLDNILHAAQRGAGLTRQLLSFSRSQSLAPMVVDPHSELPRLMELLKPSLRGDIGVEIRVSDDIWLIEIDTAEWEIALLNIAVNARDAMPLGGSLRVTAENRIVRHGEIATAPDLSGSFVCIALHDSGPGIPASVAARAFEPFFTTKDVGRGTGLGLSQVYGFARQAGGAATIAASEAGGTIVALYLPRTAKAVQPETRTAFADEARDGFARRIMVVEDNDDVAAITVELIEALGYEVVRVDRARAALDRLMAPGAMFHLLLTDVVMPDGMNGLQLARAVRARLPALPIILISGYNEAASEGTPEFPMLRKPLPAEQLVQAIRAELGAYPRIVVDNTRAG